MNADFWDVVPCRSCEMNRRFGGTYRLHLQGRSVHFTGSRRHHIPEDGILHSHRCENLKSYKLIHVSALLTHPQPTIHLLKPLHCTGS
jgi:hypothetical protein